MDWSVALDGALDIRWSISRSIVWSIPLSHL